MKLKTTFCIGSVIFHSTLSAAQSHKPYTTLFAQPAKDFNLMNCINQKGLRPQDEPISITELNQEEKTLLVNSIPACFDRFAGSAFQLCSFNNFTLLTADASNQPKRVL